MKQYLYVCLFSNNHIKVGRSVDPRSRITQHADRVACIGVDLVNHLIVECASDSVSSERDLIEKCKKLASKKNKNEWFEGLVFEEICQSAISSAESFFPKENRVECFSTNHDLRVVQKRLGSLGNLAEFGRRWKVPYRTLQRIRSGVQNTNYSTMVKITKALDKDSIIGGVK